MNISSTPTANLMTPFEPILVELVNPTPGYQPGTGKEDGAQIVQGANGYEWWAPELGCDSLDATLEAIRYRISRYLRKPVAGVEMAPAPIPPADGEVAELTQWLEDTGYLAMQANGEEGERYFRAATLLRQLEQVAYAASDYLCGTRFPEFANEHGGIDSLKTNLSRLVAHFEHGPRPVPGVDVPGPDGDFGGIEELCNAEGVDVRIGAPLLKRAQKAWLSTTPPTPAAGEVGELVTWLGVVSEQFRLAELDDEATQTDRAATLLRQLSAAQAPQPVAVDSWQPIEIAPKDGTEIMASDYDAIEIVSWVAPRFDVGITGEWVNREGEAMYPAWWQPLADHPPLPATTPAGEEGV